MAYRCNICARGPSAGNSISHSRNATKRRFLPNLQKIKINLSGKIQRAYVCTSCIHSGRIQKVA